MKLSELIAYGERLVDTVRDFRRGASAVADAVPKGAQVAAEAMQQLGRTNAKLRREVMELRAKLDERPTRDVLKLHEKIHGLERQVRTHRETIQGYFEELDAEARKGNPNGKAASASIDGQ